MKRDILAGVKVIELVRVPPAELPGMMLGDLGAEVLKIETPEPSGRPAPVVRSIRHAHTNRNKRSIALNLKQPEGRALLQQLAAEADVLIEGFRPGVLRRLGADHATLSALNPRLVYCSMSGFGQDGPDRATPAHDLNFIARAGVLDLLGPSGDWAIPLNLVADFGGAAMHAAFGIMAALYDRQQTGVGQYLDISYLEATVALAAGTPNFRGLTTDAVLTGRGKGVLSGAYPYYTVYRTRDGKGLTVACSEQRLWDNFCRALGLTDLACHGRHPDHYRRAPDAEERAARERIAEHIGTRDLSDWLRHLQDADTCVAPVNDATGLLDDPQLRHRGLFVDTEHPSEGRVRHIGSPIRLSNAQVGPRRAAPLPGEHTDAVLADLGLSSADIMRLRAVGVVN